VGIIVRYVFGHNKGKSEGLKEGYYYESNRARMDEDYKKHPMVTDKEYNDYKELQEKGLYKKLH